MQSSPALVGERKIATAGLQILLRGSLDLAKSPERTFQPLALVPAGFPTAICGPSLRRPSGFDSGGPGLALEVKGGHSQIAFLTRFKPEDAGSSHTRPVLLDQPPGPLEPILISLTSVAK